MAEDGRTPTGQFAHGNKLWKMRSSAGPKPIFKTPEELWAACEEYFDWCHSTPLVEAKAFSYEGEVTIAELPKMRAMTIVGLCIFLDIDETTWRDWKSSRPDLSLIVTRVERIIYEQKFSGAAAGLLVPNIIARDLGLVEKKEVDSRATILVHDNFKDDDD